MPFGQNQKYKPVGGLSLRDVRLEPDELQAHARDLSISYTSQKRIKYRNWPDIAEEKKVLVSAYRSVCADAKNGFPIVPAAEWLIDNFYLLEENLKELVSGDRQFGLLPSIYYSNTNMPRIYWLAAELIMHTDGNPDEKSILSFIQGYQQGTELDMSELWILPDMLRIGLLKLCAQLARECESAHDMQEKARKWLDVLLFSAGHRQKLRKHLIAMERETNFAPPFLESLLSSLREHENTAEMLSWIDKRLETKGITPANVIQAEHRRQMQNQYLMGNAITSLRKLETLSWASTFESLSSVEQQLRKDETYLHMDFSSREHYRKRIRKLALELDTSEALIAKKAVDCAQGKDGRFAEAGWYFWNGLKDLLSALDQSPSQKMKFTGWSKRHARSLYKCSIIIASFILCVLTYYLLAEADRYFSLALAIISFLPLFGICQAIAGRISTMLKKPVFLSKLDFQNNIPEEHACMVVVPTLISSKERALEIIAQMEVYYLSNQSKNMYFSLLGDFPDNKLKELAGEDEIIAAAEAEIYRLNEKYPGDVPVFYYLHREREWHERDGMFMGKDRKRGALMDFMRLLLDEESGTWLSMPNEMPDVKYVLTLDADTQLPRDSAIRLVSTLAHPLNSPVLVDGKLVYGYSVLQPRLGVTVTSAARSPFALIFSGQTGVDPYTFAVSDVYQDLFGEGIFTGKGIFELRSFMQLVDGWIAQSSFVSHDLLEGCLAKVGLVTDVELIDGYPYNYVSYCKRQHRWTRGDWQFMPWLFPRVRTEKGTRKNPLKAMSKWKIFDNMRRSLQPLLLMLLLVFGILLPGKLAVCLTIVLLALCIYLVFDTLALLKNFFSRKAKKTRLSRALYDLRNSFLQAILNLVFLPYDALNMADAIIRAVYRMAISRKKMLEWVTAADAERNSSNDLSSYFKRMWISPVLGFVLSTASYYLCQPNWWGCFPLFAAWIAAPLIAYAVSQPFVSGKSNLNESDKDELYAIARKTWRYFEDFAGSQNGFLAPDNYQIQPRKGLVERTSPTNIGFTMLATLDAHHLGFIGLTRLAHRIGGTMETVSRLEKWNGHLYNWYDTRTMETLRPKYVSSVDSGNLASMALLCSRGFESSLSAPHFGQARANGFLQTLKLSLFDEDETRVKKLSGMMNTLASSKESTWRDHLQWLELLEDLSQLPDRAASHPWTERLKLMAQEASQDMQAYMPWVYLIKKIPYEIDATTGAFFQLISENSAPKKMIENENEILESLSHVIINARKKKDHTEFIEHLQAAVAESFISANNIISRVTTITRSLEELMYGTDFKSLYDEQRELFCIGFDAETGKASNSYYDLLASEARLTSILAIAKGDIPQKHWFRLGRPLTLVGDRRMLISWGGTMFEYLMPQLFLKNFDLTLLYETYESVLVAQKSFAESMHTPWGVSESGYYAFDLSMYYQYKSFGVPKTGLKSGLSKDVVISPYSSFLALMTNPSEACKNIRMLKSEGVEGEYGFYEAVDYTLSRSEGKRKHMIVKSHMAHHMGMSLAAIDNCLNDGILAELFHSDPIIKSAELLLQERLPSRSVHIKEYEDTHEEQPIRMQEISANRIITDCGGPPKCHMLSNGRYSIMLTHTGVGYSECSGIAVNRWRPDACVQEYGMFTIIKDSGKDMVFSTAFQPLGYVPESYEVRFEPDKASFMRKDGPYRTKMEVCITPEDDVEIRRLTIQNSGPESNISAYSFFEPLLCDQRDDIAHMAFSNLSIETEFLAEYSALIVKRRPRQRGAAERYLLFMVAGGDCPADYETDRSRFYGRTRGPGTPVQIDEGFLGRNTGAVLDPILCLEQKMDIKQGESKSIIFVTGVAKDRAHALELAARYSRPENTDKAFEMAWTYSQVELRYLGMNSAQANIFQELVAPLIFRLKNTASGTAPKGSKEGLWRFGISGDIPYVLVNIRDVADLNAVRQIIGAHEFLRIKGLIFDLVLLIEYENDYQQTLKDRLDELISSSHARDLRYTSGGIFELNGKDLSETETELLKAYTQLYLDASTGLGEQIRLNLQQRPNNFMAKTHAEYGEILKESHELLFENGIGGFSKDGMEYVIRLADGATTPAPWTNIIANERFGFAITESGGGYTWFQNCRENRITTFNNDAVKDNFSEILYFRDSETGRYWNPCRGPVRAPGHYTVRHGAGYSGFEYGGFGLQQNICIYSDANLPIKYTDCIISNPGSEKRKLDIFYYIRPNMGFTDDEHTAVWYTEDSKAMLMQNPYNIRYGSNVAFVCVPGYEYSYCCSQIDFIGLNHGLDRPLALACDKLPNNGATYGAPCAAMQISVEIPAGESIQLCFMMGCGEDMTETEHLLDVCQMPLAAQKAIDAVRGKWNDLLGKVKVETPDTAMDFMLNHWLKYQVFSSRLWGKSGFYQSGGAFGFRDQLQDSLSLMMSFPEITKRQILLNCSHQFIEGDVQHWWHEPRTGVRTKISDDVFWLVYSVVNYLDCSGDLSMLDEEIPYLEGNFVPEGEHNIYETPFVSDVAESVYLHCQRALDSVKFGEHGLPLIGCGDWNDGMDRVGELGRGESVFNAWIGIICFSRFAEICTERGDKEMAHEYASRADDLLRAVETHGWDGQWYRRAYFDDGTPLGSTANPECSIDCLSQAWAVFCGKASNQRIDMAMRSLENRLIDKEHGIIALLTPPFDSWDVNVGYIAGYVPGVRENGGQYSHAAVWTIIAMCLLERRNDAHFLWNMINPISHTSSFIETSRYKGEPYVIAGDVYSAANHKGRAGWTWYTGSAGWMYRAGVEHVLGIQKRGNNLEIKPCVPPNWQKYYVEFSFGKSLYKINIFLDGKDELMLDGLDCETGLVPLVDDGAKHMVEAHR